MKFLRILRKNEKGATAIEYGLIAALIAVAAITALTNLGSSLNTTFSTVGGKLDTANTSAN
ncbi:Flp family type IVb pilin [Novosphingobium sp. Gsoil 351]|uniref:Flp family type IVb pilin n=1 Tax=Novosphingobium sp. Gsoil 351 TaxID=2675225 RepID=UPI0012B46D56|nr:Flp family type IVb pilin [Novosphingobium sp. Gsoil 351]QGN53711.1 Flp family type IVb pilin [Novosphingobium sp. Gsoil 351]